jgi:hypothetical protein
MKTTGSTQGFLARTKPAVVNILRTPLMLQQVCLRDQLEPLVLGKGILQTVLVPSRSI